MNIVIGFDGGGTFSRFLITKNDTPPQLTVVRESIKPSETSLEHSCARFIDLLRGVLGDESSDIKGIAISLSGIAGTTNKTVFSQCVADAFQLKPHFVYVESDALFGLQAAYDSIPSAGLYAIIGTGSVITARTYEGEVIKAGGWGKTLGDQGSAYALGVSTMRYYCRALDGFEQKGILFERISQYLEQRISGTTVSINEYICSNHIIVTEIAIITLSTSEADTIAEQLVSDSVSYITDDITTFYKIYKEQLPSIVTLQGGMLENQIYKQWITDELRKNGFTVTLLKQGDILQYALKKARELIA